MTLGEIATLRLAQLGLGPVEAAERGGIERAFIRDLIVGRKKTVRSDKLPDLARALHLDAQALARGELVPVEEEDLEAAEIVNIMSRLPEAGRDELLGRARSLYMKHRGSVQTEGGLGRPPGKGEK